MGDIPANVVSGDEISAAEFNLLRDLGFIVDIAAGETINGATLPVAVYFDNTENEWMACDGNVAAKKEFAGIAITNAVNGGVITVQTCGRVTGFSGLGVGDRMFVQDDQTLGNTPGTISIYVGIAVTATDILILGSGKFVELEGAQTIDGIKTFGSIPLLPASNPTTANQATRKTYVDLKGILVFADTQVHNANAPSSWTDLDLSSVVGSNRAFVLLRLQNNGANSRLFRFRENGEATEMSGQDSGMTAVFVINGQFTYVLILTDTSGIIEWITTATVPSTEIRVRAYMHL